jgi:non-heme chloroperoxidase
MSTGIFKRMVLLAFFADLACALNGGVIAGNYVQVSPELKLYYVEAGKGTPIIFIPGWTGTTEVMRQQIAHYSKRYRAISFDPRSQGRSSRTPENNNYVQHGLDLGAFIEVLKLKDVILVGHSWGCLDAYAYFRVHGTGNVKAFVCIDQNPKNIVEKEGDWGLLKAAADLKGFHDGFTYERLKTTREFLQLMVTRPLTEAENRWFVTQLAKTSTSVAVLLDYDGNMADYTAEAKMIDGKIPVLNVLSNPGWVEGWTDMGKSWLANNAPHSEVADFGLHLMFWEFPDKFNAVLDTFLQKVN